MARVVLVAAALHGLATFVHFVHNAAYLDHYPGLPESWTPFGVLFSWAFVGMFGLLGTALWFNNRNVAQWLLTVFGLLGLAGLGHFLVAPPRAHEPGMLWTIAFEAATGVLLLTALTRNRFRQNPRTS